MSDYCVFDQLPAELLHIVFNYFSTSELLFTFHNVSDYVNATLESYSTYQLDFQSISKFHFRRLCRHVRPEQVISLTLSDGDDTPGLSDVFFSRFQMEQFTRLRSLTLIEIEFNSLESIFVNLPQLHELRSFSFDAYSIRHTYGSIDLNSYEKIIQINSILRDTYTQIFPRLYFLSLNGSWVLDSISLPNLLDLKLDHCPATKFKIINDIAPKLRSLDICVKYECIDFELPVLPSRLTRLRLKIDDILISMSHMEWLLQSCTYLKHLELHLRGSSDLAEGEYWSLLAHSLITFNFKFYMIIVAIEETLNSFRTPFWLEEKRWFVAYQDRCLFTVPYFAPVEVSTLYRPPIHFTAPNDGIFYENVTKLNMEDPSIPLVQLIYPIVRTNLLRTIDLCNLKSLSIPSLDDLLQFAPIERKMAHLSQLSIKNEITRKQLKRMINNPCEQIRTLEIETKLQGDDRIIEGLFRIFPHIERLIYKPDIQSIGLMAHFIDGFTHLSSASFKSLGLLHNQDIKFRFNPDLMLLRAHRPSYGTSICRIYRLLNWESLFGIYWWIEE